MRRDEKEKENEKRKYDSSFSVASHMRWTGRSLMTHEDQWALVSQRFVSRFSRVEQLTADVTHVRHHLSLNERSVPFRSVSCPVTSRSPKRRTGAYSTLPSDARS